MISVISRVLFLLALFAVGQLSYAGPTRRPTRDMTTVVNSLEIETNGNELSFNKKSLEVKPGQKVALTFKNMADEESRLKHTWVLVKPGTSDEVASTAVEAGVSQNYIPKDPNILASTKLVAPGQSETIYFTAPREPGSYPYICTVPGHSRSLHGELVVK